MLRQLHILNYAIIEEILIDFSGKLNVITGETGAGKSILMGALSLILGDRADTSVLLVRDKKCFIEGVFIVENKSQVREFLKANDLDADEELVIRREIAASGKSRAFVNDTPVNLDQLKKLSSLLVDLHRQFDTLELAASDFQREVVDALSGNQALLANYQDVFRQFSAVKRELADLQEQKARFNKEFDYNKFLFSELQEAALKENELEEMDSELRLLNNAETIKNALMKVIADLNDGDHPLVQQLKIGANQLLPFSSMHAALPPLLQRLQSAYIELADIAGELESINDHVSYDPRKIEAINERMSAGYKLLKKHNVKTTNDLLSIRDELEKKLALVLSIDGLILSKENEAETLLAAATEKASQLSKNRHARTGSFEKQVNQLLSQVGMPNARLKVELKKTELTNFGYDATEFLFDANKSGRLEPLRKVASGGELSRLMLCIKSLVAESIDLPTLIFDEIDTGISGEAAKQVGFILKGLSQQRQVICITHQPQIAGKGDAHYLVYKEIRGEAVKTNIRLLTNNERITTIAKMLGGEKPTAAALENAREMVMN